MKSYRVVLSDDLSNIYEDIARVNKKKVEECLSIYIGKGNPHDGPSLRN